MQEAHTGLGGPGLGMTLGLFVEPAKLEAESTIKAIQNGTLLMGHQQLVACVGRDDADEEKHRLVPIASCRTCQKPSMELRQGP